MGALLAFALSHIRGIVTVVAILAALLAVVAAKHAYDEGQRERGRVELRAAISEETHRQCGERAETPADCFKAGQNSVQHEFAVKIEAANRTIVDTTAALETANRSIDALRAEGQRRATEAAKALASLESRAKDAADKLAALQLAQPTGATPCDSACSLLRSSW